MKIKVIEIGSTLIDADAEYQEPDIRAAIDAGGDVGDVITECTDTERSNVSCDEYAVACDEYAVACEDDGTLLWHGWLSGDRNAEPPPQARAWYAEMSAADRAAAFAREA